MKLNIEKVNQLIAEDFRNNKSFFADEIGVDRAYLSTILNGNGKEDSPKVCNAIVNFCNNNSLDFKKYIFLP